MKALSKKLWLALGLLSAVLLTACGQKSVQFAGETQGTTYHVTVVPEKNVVDANALQQRVEQRLADIDAALSNYREDSELSRFNRAPVGEWIAIGPDLYTVLKISDQISESSGGAFDVTVAPLVALWGFGPDDKQSEQIPDDAAIAAAKALVDFRRLEIDATQARVRKQQPLTIDVNGIAQGYSVDKLAELLANEGFKNYLVEVGGELRLVGHSPRGTPWRIGIEKPSDGFAEAQQALIGTNIGVTTAGDYHDYFEKDDVRYSHTIDPRTGRPIAHKLASVTVIADSAVLADGWDTALEVLGPEQGYDLAERLHLAAYFIVRGEKDFSVRYTPEMKPYLGER